MIIRNDLIQDVSIGTQPLISKNSDSEIERTFRKQQGLVMNGNDVTMCCYYDSHNSGKSFQSCSQANVWANTLHALIYNLILRLILHGMAQHIVTSFSLTALLVLGGFRVSSRDIIAKTSVRIYCEPRKNFQLLLVSQFVCLSACSAIIATKKHSIKLFVRYSDLTVQFFI